MRARKKKEEDDKKRRRKEEEEHEEVLSPVYPEAVLLIFSVFLVLRSVNETMRRSDRKQMKTHDRHIKNNVNGPTCLRAIVVRAYKKGTPCLVIC